MQTFNELVSNTTPKVPWNKGKLLGSKPPLQTKQVWAIRTKLQVEQRLRDLAMFNLAIDSKLRGCDLVRLRLRTLLRTDLPWSGQPSASGKPDIR
jgi:hypothetical protein